MSMTEQGPRTALAELTTEIVAAYVSNNTVAPSEIAGLIAGIYQALSRASDTSRAPSPEELKPAVAVKKSVTAEQITCLECGKKFKSVKRHLRTHHNQSPEEYRERWDLGPEYPMVAPNYAAARSQLAKKMGLGTRREK